jgi:hypothetical protein
MFYNICSNTRYLLCARHCALARSGTAVTNKMDIFPVLTGLSGKR